MRSPNVRVYKHLNSRVRGLLEILGLVKRIISTSDYRNIDATQFDYASNFVFNNSLYDSRSLVSLNHKLVYWRKVSLWDIFYVQRWVIAIHRARMKKNA